MQAELVSVEDFLPEAKMATSLLCPPETGERGREGERREGEEEEEGEGERVGEREK